MKFVMVLACLFAWSIGKVTADDPAVPGLAGIGAVLVERNGTPVITEVIAHSPAADGGLKAQDSIVWVDYRDVAGMELPDVVGLIRGEEGSTVVISVLRPGETKARTFTLTRRPIQIEP